ncbi:MAG: hypothetical protein ACRDXE_06515, partial [Acidimicrobiales bacterium]
GPLQTAAPAATFVVFYAVGGALVVMALLVTGRRVWASLALTVGAALVGPIIAQFVDGPSHGIVVQGRYLLPLVVGVPLTAALVVPERVGLEPGYRRVVLAVATLLAISQVWTFYGTLRRYAVGTFVPYNPFRRVSGSWYPPIGPPYLDLLFATAAAIFVVSVVMESARWRLPSPAPISGGQPS